MARFYRARPGPTPYALNVLTVAAHAKVNLTLAVGPPEPPGSARPGWHKIASWMSCIDLADDLTLTRGLDGASSSFAIGWAADAPLATPIDWPTEKDLAVRAHRLLEQHAGRPLPVDMRLAKRIPVGGGLGGGSSDAAAMLTALNELFTLDLPLEKLRQLGAQLGSDVAFFIDDHHPPRPAVISGFGENVRHVPPINADLLLVIPPFSCPTPEVYTAYDALPDGPGVRTLNAPMVHALAMNPAGRLDPSGLFNALLPAACRAQPRLAGLVDGVRAALRTLPGPPVRVHLSGSGSCLFIVLDREHRPPQVAMAVAAAARGCALHRTRLA